MCSTYRKMSSHALMTWFSLADISVCACRKKLLWCLPLVFSAIGVHPEFYSSTSLFFLCRILCDGLAKKKKKELSEQCIIPLEAERCARQAKCFAAGHEGKKLLFFFAWWNEQTQKTQHQLFTLPPPVWHSDYDWRWLQGISKVAE